MNLPIYQYSTQYRVPKCLRHIRLSFRLLVLNNSQSLRMRFTVKSGQIQWLSLWVITTPVFGTSKQPWQLRHYDVILWYSMLQLFSWLCNMNGLLMHITHIRKLCKLFHCKAFLFCFHTNQQTRDNVRQQYKRFCTIHRITKKKLPLSPDEKNAWNKKQNNYKISTGK